MKYSYDLVIVTTTFFGLYGTVSDGKYRERLFLDEVDSLSKADKNGLRIIWLIHDDVSPEFPDINVAGVDLFIVRSKEKLGYVGAILLAIAHAIKFAPIVLTLDSDGLIAKDCLPRLWDLRHRYPQQGIFGTFNTRYHHTLEDRGDHVMKESLCEHGVLFRSSLWLGNRPNYALLANLKCEGPFPCLKPSGVQHTGQYGLNGTMDDFDTNFIP